MPRCVRAHTVFELAKAGGIAARPSFRAMALFRPLPHLRRRGGVVDRAWIERHATRHLGIRG
jgi:hypothetical protein